MTIQELEQNYNPCYKGIQFVKEQGSLQKAWENCTDPSWILWYLQNQIDKQTSILFSRMCYMHISHHDTAATTYATNAAAYADARKLENKWQCDTLRSLTQPTF